MEKADFHKKQVDKIKDNRLLGSGTENSVFEIPGSDFVYKVSKGSTAKFVNHSGFVKAQQEKFDISNITPEVRKSFVIDHTLAKILHILFPSSVPNRLGLYTKFYPRYLQEKISGKKEYEDIERVYDRESEIPQLGDEQSPKFRVKPVRFPTITDKGMGTKKNWEEKIKAFTEKLKSLGIEIDTINVNENFIKTFKGEYKYIDTFSFSDPAFVVQKINEKILELEARQQLSGSNLEKLKHLLKRFERLTYAQVRTTQSC
mgnify:CR=1 FL=1